MSHRIPSNRLDRSPDCRNRQCNCTVANIVSQHSGIHHIHPAGELIRGEVGETLRRVGLSHVLCKILDSAGRGIWAIQATPNLGS